MFEIIKTDTFDAWLAGLRDARARSRIQVRLDRLALGNMGDAKFFDGIGELRIDYGSGYRVYFLQRASIVVILLCGGDKSTQAADIKTAKSLAQSWKRQEKNG